MHGGGNGFHLVLGPEGRRGIGGQLRAWSLRSVTLGAVIFGAVVRLLWVIRLLYSACVVLVVCVRKAVTQWKTITIDEGVEAIDIRIASAISHPTVVFVRTTSLAGSGPVSWAP